MLDAEGRKRCIECGELKDAKSSFWKHKNTKDGFFHRCAQCAAPRCGPNATIRNDDEDDVKYCPKCEQTLPKLMFDANRSDCSGRQGYCKECMYKDKENETERKCSVCKQVFPISYYHKCGSGHQSCCKPCNIRRGKESKFMNVYGMTLGQFDDLHEAQKGLCAICGKAETRTTNSKSKQIAKLCVDHCHKLGKVRALLCFNCNSGIGLLMHNPTLLRKAAVYIEEHEVRSQKPTHLMRDGVRVIFKQ
jgi:hypothetical protein